ncbi:uncharacterized protein LOC128336563 [Hemicordylus capensis]|uniref:uncharacterized protein LOC128336563 n=1 Tax=Hemicordylus capensis TaxID=884348 RepID=UPI0023039B09|nr:uncharacterized protein LOC128336563 [Hemicordylus capensis]
MTGSRLMRYQLALLEDPEVELQVATSLNPASYLPDAHTERRGTHNCQTLLQQTWAARPDLQTIPLKNADLQWFTDGSSFVEEGIRKAGYAVVSLVDTIEAQPLPTETSAELAELIAVTRACEMAEGQTLNLYSDSKYVHNMAHAYAALHHERGMLDSKGNPVKYQHQIQKFMDAIQKPKKLAFMHCKGHQKGGGEVERGNQRADAVAKQAARSAEMIMVSLIPDLAATEEDREYGMEDVKLAEAMGAKKQDGKWLLKGGKTLVPKEHVPKLVEGLHEGTHMGAEAMYELIRKKYYAPNLSAYTRQIARKCIECAKVNPNTRPQGQAGQVAMGVGSMDIIQVDFTEMVRQGPYKYLLVIVCTLTGWVEAKPCKAESAQAMVKYLLNDHLPNHGLPTQINSDNGGAFVSKAVQDVSRALGIQWKLHSAWNPQSSAKVERMNRTIKDHLAKLIELTQMNWVALLPYVLYKIRNTPRGKEKLTPFEAMYGRASPILRMGTGDHPPSTAQWAKVLHDVWGSLQKNIPIPIVDPVHSYEVGEWVWVKKWKVEPLRPRWGGPYQILLVTPTALKCAGIKAWVHHTRVKRAEAPVTWTTQRIGETKLKI